MVLCALALGCLLATQVEAAKNELTPEEYVIQQVKNGEWADLLEQFVLPRMAQERRWLVREKGLVGYLDLLEALCPKEKEAFLKKYEKDLQIGTRFLEDLLIGELRVKVHRKGIKIKNAVIADYLDLDLAHIPHSTYLYDCLFKEGIICLDAVFEKDFMICGSHLKKEAYFSKVKVIKSLSFYNATFQGPVFFRSADIAGQFTANGAKFLNETQKADFNCLRVGQLASFQGTEFYGPVDFVYADIGLEFNAKRAKFLNETEKANFSSLKVGKHANFENARFQGPVVFGEADICGEFIANGAKSLSKEHPATFGGMKVGQVAFFQGAEFYGPVDFVYVDIGLEFNAKRAKFLNENKKANFNSMKVGQHANFINTSFQGPADFFYADIGGEFNFEGAVFLNEEKKAKFISLKVGQHAGFNSAIFYGPVTFVGAEIKGQFNANWAQFLNQEANFNSMKVGQHAGFNNAIFWGPVTFVGAEFKGQFIATWAQFLNQEANFGSMKVDDAVHLENATFQGPVNFASADIGGHFTADGAKFLSREKMAIFQGMRVGQNAFFRNVTFKSDIDISYSTFLDLSLSGAEEGKQAKPENLTRLSLKGTEIKRQLTLENFKLTNLEASHLRVKGMAKFEKVFIKWSTDFQNANVAALIFNDIEWPEKETNLKLDGLTYNSLCVDTVDTADNFPGLLGLVESAAFNPQNYLGLEKYCTRAGHQNWSNEVYISGKRREIRETWNWWDYWKWPFEKVLLDLGVGYGRHPVRALYFSGLFILLGWWVFSRPGVLTRKAQENETRKVQEYDARIGLGQVFWFSFDAFVPVISLGPDKIYEIDIDRQLKLSRFLPHINALTYFYLHQIAGYILVTIGVLAITGIIK
jgi:hypothetical protein